MLQKRWDFKSVSIGKAALTIGGKKHIVSQVGEASELFLKIDLAVTCKEDRKEWVDACLRMFDSEFWNNGP